MARPSTPAGPSNSAGAPAPAANTTAGVLLAVALGAAVWVLSRRHAQRQCAPRPPDASGTLAACSCGAEQQPQREQPAQKARQQQESRQRQVEKQHQRPPAPAPQLPAPPAPLPAEQQQAVPCLPLQPTSPSKACTDGGRPAIALAVRAVSLEPPAAPAVVSPFAAAQSPFEAAAAAAIVPSDEPGAPASDGVSGSAAGSPLDRRHSPPHLSVILGAQPYGLAAGPTCAVPSVQRRLSASFPSRLGAAAPGTAPLGLLRAELADAQPLDGPPMLERLQPARSISLAGGQTGGGGDGSSLLAAAAAAHELSEWEVSPSELEICRRPDGSLHQLGTGGFGRVYKARRRWRASFAGLGCLLCLQRAQQPPASRLPCPSHVCALALPSLPCRRCALA